MAILARTRGRPAATGLRSGEQDNQIASFHLPLSPEAYEELQVLSLNPLLNSSQPEEDSWSYSWGGKFLAKKFYDFCHRHIVVPIPYAWIWASKLHMKLKVFMWFLLSNRLNTRNMLKRRHYHIGTNFACVLCDSTTEETIEHLILFCHFSTLCCSKVGISWNSNLSRLSAFQEAKLSFSGDLFFAITGIVAWNIWKERNNYIFRHITPDHSSSRKRTREDLLWLKYRVDPKFWDYITLLALSL